ncbi:MAG: N-acetylmuramoyl-L-alanine amidase [Christensenellales bacterium]|jgi:N-acetylmuramoyl-L-alanine amidase
MYRESIGKLARICAAIVLLMLLLVGAGAAAAEASPGEIKLTAANHATVQKLSKPAGVQSVKHSSSAVKVSWDRVKNAKGYIVYRSNSPEGGYIKLLTLQGGATLAHIDRKITPGRVYYYKIVAYAPGYKNSSASTRTLGTTVLKKPTGLTVKLKSAASIQVGWDAMPGVRAYYIYRSEKPNEGFKKIASVKGRLNTSYLDTGLRTSKQYYYRVASYRVLEGRANRSYNCASSERIVLLARPAGVKAVQSGDSAAKITWSQVAKAKGYHIYRAESQSGSYKKIGSVSGGALTSYQDKSISKSGVYHYKIVAYISEKSSASNSQSSAASAGVDLRKLGSLFGKIVILDPGHGYNASGYASGGSYKGYVEAKYNLIIANKIRKNLADQGAVVYMTRTGSSDVTFAHRMAKVNKYVLQQILKNDTVSAAKKTEINRLIRLMDGILSGTKKSADYFNIPYDYSYKKRISADLRKVFEIQGVSPFVKNNMIFISVHSNATGYPINESVSGTSAFYMTNACRYTQNYYTKYSYGTKNAELARLLMTKVADAAGFKRHGAYVEDYFMIREHNIPGALLESAFHTNASDRKKLMSAAYQNKIAAGVTDAVKAYYRAK